MSNSKYEIKDSDIAIIGMSGKFPGADSVTEFWDKIKNGIDCITRSDSDFSKAPRNFINAFGALKDIKSFDASFFDISDKEAVLLDPQQRLLLETVYEALENSGYVPESNNRIGLFAGADEHYYIWDSFFNAPFYTQEDYYGKKLYLGGSLTSRVSYKLNLTGPSLTVRAACATSLVTTHLACQSLLNYECDIALAGGVNIYPFQDGYYAFEGTVSTDGYTRPFDASAQGFVPGNGVGIVVLKRLEDALQDHDFIYAVIRGSSVNNDGSQKIGYSAPSVSGEMLAIKEAQMVSGVKPHEIGYIETHGTATPLGDAIEIKALKQVFKDVVVEKPFCAIGSVKSNVGHLNMAAGVAGLIKTTLMLHHMQIPPSIHFKTPNSELELENSPFYVNTELKNWDSNGNPRIAGVSSFGIGGTNVHIVMEEAPEVEKHINPLSSNIILLSAKTSTALDCLAQNLSNHIDNHSNLNLDDISYTLQTGRNFFEHRRFEVCNSPKDASFALKKISKNKNILNSPVTPEVVFMFPSSASYYPKMGKCLYDNNYIFKSEMDKCFRIINSMLNIEIKEILFNTDEETAISNINSVLYMPIIFSISYCLAKLFMSLGIKPRALMGHSLGEYVAACLSGVFTLEDALYLVVERSKLFETLDEGSMISVSVSEDIIAPILPQGISISAINGPKRLMLSGAKSTMDEFIKLLKEKDIAYVVLKTNRAGHSCLVDKILPNYEECLNKVKFGKVNIPIISTYSGNWIDNNQMCNSSYWLKHMREPVRFSSALETLIESDNLLLLEAGPGQQLTMLSRNIVKKDRNQFVVSSLPDLKEDSNEWSNFLHSLGNLWLHGIEIDWNMLYNNQLPYKLPLPSYPFERKPYWKLSESAMESQRPSGICNISQNNNVQSITEVSDKTFLVFDGMSESQFELTKYLCSKTNSRIVLAELENQKRDNTLSQQKSDNVLLLSQKNNSCKSESNSYQMDDETKMERFIKLKEIKPDIEVIYIGDYEPNQIENCIKTVKASCTNSSMIELIMPSYIDDIYHQNTTKISDEEGYRNDIDKILAEIIMDVVGVKITSIKQSIMELGFDSLSGLILSSRIRKAFNIDFTIRELYQLDSICELSDFISKLQDNTQESMPVEINQVEKGTKTLDDLLSEL